MQNLSIKTCLLAATGLSITVLGVPAHAFDTIQWDWQLNVQTDVNQAVDINATANPVGIAILENDQIFVGSATADSTVTAPVNVLNPAATTPYPTDDLAKVENVATAVGNNASIESDISANIDSSQTAGVETTTVPATFDPITGAELTPEVTLSVIQPAVITATASVTGAQNVQIENSAQALANNLTITMDGPTNDDRTLIANNVQVAYATATATSNVDSPTVTNFGGMGTLDEPWVNSSAIAVGNNFSVTIEAPTVP